MLPTVLLYTSAVTKPVSVPRFKMPPPAAAVFLLTPVRVSLKLTVAFPPLLRL